jgi:hypothetical protein
MEQLKDNLAVSDDGEINYKTGQGTHYRDIHNHTDFGVYASRMLALLLVLGIATIPQTLKRRERQLLFRRPAPSSKSSTRIAGLTHTRQRAVSEVAFGVIRGVTAAAARAPDSRYLTARVKLHSGRDSAPNQVPKTSDGESQQYHSKNRATCWEIAKKWKAGGR